MTAFLIALLIPAADAPPTSYAEVAAKRARAAVAAANVGDPAKAARAEAVVAAHYVGLHDVHNVRDEAVKAAAGDKERIAQARARAEADVRVVHARFKAGLAAELTPVQSEAVEDQMTYNVVPLTHRNYQAMLPALTGPQKAKILDLLKQGREAALVAGSSNEKHETFGKYKGKITNYLSAEGYDLKQAGREWAERRKAAEASGSKK